MGVSKHDRSTRRILGEAARDLGDARAAEIGNVHRSTIAKYRKEFDIPPCSHALCSRPAVGTMSDIPDAILDAAEEVPMWKKAQDSDDPAQLNELAFHPDPRVRCSVVENQHTWPHTLDIITRRELEAPKKVSDISVLRSLASRLTTANVQAANDFGLCMHRGWAGSGG